MTAKPETDNLIPTSHTATGHAYCSVPNELKRIAAWLPFKTELRQENDRGVRKTNKVPYNAFHRKARYTDRREWMTFEAALQMVNTGRYDGLGIVLLSEHGIVGYDADGCISDGRISPRADAHVAMLNTYTEVSLSGTGIHCLAFGTLPARGRRSDGFEMYSDKRYFVVTGRQWPGVSAGIEHREAELKAVHEDIFGRVVEEDAHRAPSVTQFPPITQEESYRESEESYIESTDNRYSLRSGSFSLSDRDVIRLLANDKCKKRYFFQGASQTNPSKADWALGHKLAFYTNGDLEQMHRLFRRSALGRRPKCWTMRGSITYLEYTLRRCLDRQKKQKNFYRPSTRPAKSPQPRGAPLSETSRRILDAHRQMPDLRACGIARLLGVAPAAVRQALCRQRRRERAANAGPNEAVAPKGNSQPLDREGPQHVVQDEVIRVDHGQETAFAPVLCQDRGSNPETAISLELCTATRDLMTPRTSGKPEPLVGSKRAEKKSALHTAADWLTRFLIVGPARATDLFAAAKMIGIAPITLRRASKILGLRPSKSGMTGGWSWSLSPG